MAQYVEGVIKGISSVNLKDKEDYNSSSYLNTYAIVSDKKVLNEPCTTMCFAPAFRANYERGEVVAIVSKLRDTHHYAHLANCDDIVGINHPLLREYLEWLLTGVLSKCYISDDVEQIIKDTAIVVDAKNIPCHMTFVGLVAFRYLWEYPLIINSWGEYVKLGVDKGQAFILAHLASKPFNSDKYSLGINDCSGGTNHCLFDEVISTDLLNSFKDGLGVSWEGDSYSSGHTSPRGIGKNLLRGKNIHFKLREALPNFSKEKLVGVFGSAKGYTDFPLNTVDLFREYLEVNNG